jgi:hypothetical protein
MDVGFILGDTSMKLGNLGLMQELADHGRHARKVVVVALGKVNLAILLGFLARS